MDSAHLHLLLNHFPIIGVLIGTGIMAYGFFQRSEAVQKAALITWILMALAAIPVFLTGEPAEERVEGLAGVSEALIEQHESAAELAIWVIEALGIFSLFALFRIHNKTMITIAFVLSLITFGLMARTGYLGGQIRHTEIGNGNTAVATPADTENGNNPAATPAEKGNGEKDDD